MINRYRHRYIAPCVRNQARRAFNSVLPFVGFIALLILVAAAMSWRYG